MAFLPESYTKRETYQAKTIDFREYRFRASELGNIMTLDSGTTLTSGQLDRLKHLTLRSLGKAKSLKGGALELTESMSKELEKLKEKQAKPLDLSIGAKSYLKELYDKEVYGIDYKFGLTCKPMQKGIEQEQASIDLYNKVYGTAYQKNEQLYKNGYITGTPDIVGKDCVKDVKSKFDKRSFNKAEDKTDKSLWVWQVKAYIWLTGTQEGSLVRTLVDTPRDIVETLVEEKLRLMMVDQEQSPELAEEVRKQVYRNHTFSHVPTSRRIKELKITLGIDDINQMMTCIKLARTYLNSLNI